MIARAFQLRVVLAAAMIALGASTACKEQPTQTHIVLDVRVARSLEDEVTSIVVQSVKQIGVAAEGAPEAVADFERGKTRRFVLLPAADKSELRIRISARHENREIAAAIVSSRYAAGEGLFLTVELGCEGAHNLGTRKASASPGETNNSCSGQAIGGEGGAGGAGGAAGETAGGGGSSGSSGTTQPIAGAGGTAGGGGTGGTAGEGGTGGNAGEGGAGSGGAGGDGGTQATAQAVTGGGGTGGPPAAGSGGGVPASGGGPVNPRAGCYTWVTVPALDGSAEIATLVEKPFVVGVETREGDATNPTVPQYVCLGTPSGTTTKLIGKGSKWGCYIPGPEQSVYTVTQNVEILSTTSSPCLAWKRLEPTTAPASPIRYGSGAGGDTWICYADHSGVAEMHATRGPRVGQVRNENGQFICRYEFYASANLDMTLPLPGSPPETAYVLDYAM